MPKPTEKYWVYHQETDDAIDSLPVVYRIDHADGRRVADYEYGYTDRRRDGSGCRAYSRLTVYDPSATIGEIDKALRCVGCYLLGDAPLARGWIWGSATISTLADMERVHA